MSRLSAKEAASTAAAEAKHAREYLVPHLVTARDAVVPALDSARRTFEEAMKDDVLPRVAAGIAATEPARDEALRRGGAAIAALRGRVGAPEAHAGRRRVGKVLILTAVAAAAVAAWRAWKLPHGSEDQMQADTNTSGAVPGTEGAGGPAPTESGNPNGRHPAAAAGPTRFSRD